MENEEKNTEELNNIENFEESSEIQQEDTEELAQSIFEEESSDMLNDELEEPAEKIAEKMTEEIKKATDEINEPLDKINTEEEIPDFLKDIIETQETTNTDIQQEEQAEKEIQEVAHQESYVSTTDEFEEETKESEKLITVRPVKFQQFENTPPNRAIKKNLDILQDISLHISVELGRTKSSIREVMEMEQGSIVELDKIAGEQVEVFVNDKLVAKGEVIVIEDKFGVRVTSTSFPKVYQ